MIDLTETLADLVRLPSVHPMGRTDLPPDILYEGRVTAYLERRLRDLGCDPCRQPVRAGRENLVTVYEPPGPPHQGRQAEVTTPSDSGTPTAPGSGAVPGPAATPGPAPEPAALEPVPALRPGAKPVTRSAQGRRPTNSASRTGGKAAAGRKSPARRGH